MYKNESLNEIRERLEGDLKPERSRLKSELEFRSQLVRNNGEHQAKEEALANQVSELRIKSVPLIVIEDCISCSTISLEVEGCRSPVRGVLQ